MSEVKELFVGLIQHLKEHQDSFVVKKRVNEVKTKRGYSDYTWWWQTKSFDEVQEIDFSKLLDEIDEFAQSFKEKG